MRKKSVCASAVAPPHASTLLDVLGKKLGFDMALRLSVTLPGMKKPLILQVAATGDAVRRVGR